MLYLSERANAMVYSGKTTVKFRSVRITIIYKVQTCRYIIQATIVVVPMTILLLLLYRKTDSRKNDLSHLGGG